MSQADTIVAGGVQGLDRFAYVGNNPVRNIDPTGHKCKGDPGECEGIHGYGYDVSGDDGGGDGIDGTEAGFTCEGHGFNDEALGICHNYEDLRDHEGWWNNGHGTFTLWAYINLVLSMEFLGAVDNIPMELLWQVLVRNFHKECQPGHCDSTSAIDVLMYFAKKHMIGTGPSQHDTSLASFSKPDATHYTIHNFAHGLVNPAESWKDGCGDGNVPCEWANKSISPGAVDSPFKEWRFRDSLNTSLENTKNNQSTDINSFYLQWGSGSTFFIATGNQLRCAYKGQGTNCSDR